MASSSSESVSEVADGDGGSAEVKTEVKEEDQDDEPEHFTSASWRSSAAVDRVKREKEEPGEPWVPVRVTQALKQSKTFAEFKEKRKFIYVHLFAGKDDILGSSIKRLADLDGLQVEVRAFDKEPGGYVVDLAQEQPFGDILDAARGGLVDGSHAGFPCGSFSRARYNEGHGPPPVRSLEYIYGLPSNNVHQQAAADRGSLLAIRSLQVSRRYCKRSGSEGCPNAQPWRIHLDQTTKQKDRLGGYRRWRILSRTSRRRQWSLTHVPSR